MRQCRGMMEPAVLPGPKRAGSSAHRGRCRARHGNSRVGVSFSLFHLGHLPVPPKCAQDVRPHIDRVGDGPAGAVLQGSGEGRGGGEGGGSKTERSSTMCRQRRGARGWVGLSSHPTHRSGKRQPGQCSRRGEGLPQAHLAVQLRNLQIGRLCQAAQRDARLRHRKIKRRPRCRCIRRCAAA